jgi:CheY-like chemotaxis protein
MYPSLDHPGAPSAVRRRLLVVQNDATLRLGYAYALHDPSTSVEMAATGTEALEKIAATPFDAVFLDFRMPGMDGIRVIETMRREGYLVPAVLCSTLQHPHATWQALRLGVVDFLLKPVQPAELRDMVDFILGTPRTRLGQAMWAARRGDLEEALRVLETPPEPDSAETCWLKALRLIREFRPGDDHGKLEEELRSCFPMLVFNRPVSAGGCGG